ncbi:MAG TPA: SAF domain-containing protein [Microlunatus sp.]
MASFFLYSQLAESQQVVAIRHTVSRGSTIEPDDLGSVRVSDTGGARTVPADQLASLVGRVAAYDLVAGSLLPQGATTDQLPPAKDRSVVGIRVAVGRAPTGFLAPGSPIRLVVLPADAADPSDGSAVDPAGTEPDGSADIATIAATVVSSEQLDDGIFLNIELDSRQAVDAASYAARDRMVVIRESER